MFVSTGDSFEDWLNWEALFALRRDGLEASPKPHYRKVGFKDVSTYGDLLVKLSSGTKVMVEVGLVHDWTMSKWREKLEADRRKLEPPYGDGFVGLQLVVIASRCESVAGDKRWAQWLGKVTFWDDSPHMERNVVLEPQGSMLIRAWSV